MLHYVAISNTQASEPCVDVIGSNFKRPYSIMKGQVTLPGFSIRCPNHQCSAEKYLQSKADLIQNEGAVFMAETERCWRVKINKCS